MYRQRQLCLTPYGAMTSVSPDPSGGEKSHRSIPGADVKGLSKQFRRLRCGEKRNDPARQWGGGACQTGPNVDEIGDASSLEVSAPQEHYTVGGK